MTQIVAGYIYSGFEGVIRVSLGCHWDFCFFVDAGIVDAEIVDAEIVGFAG